MAKWGEGDPRWIVEERPDGTNVNNWHWTEKNATNWSRDNLKELLTGLAVETDDARCEITSVTSMEGEASANNRKAKLIFFYEWVIKGEWSGQMKEGEKKYKGKFDVPNLSEEHEPDEVDVTWTVDKETDDGYKLKEIMRTQGTPMVQQQFAKYIKMLKEEYSQNINAKTEMNKMVISNDSTASKSVGVKINTKTINLQEEFVCGPTQLYRVFTDKEMVQAFTGSSAIYEVEKGGRISLMNGYVPETKIVKRWRLKTWPDAHFSEVTLEFSEKDGNTLLRLKQTGVPTTEYEKTIEGWKVNYWQRIRQVFGFGSHIF
ncbi:AHSA1-like protein [Mya arenaria]|uniref:AHSA1-like protein n=1 Tax=Mya arenaria TaxID=6604 RepID=A0ABY7FCG5_MYAAR|nr:AHSA1-like protein [Mya arenaria]